MPRAIRISIIVAAVPMILWGWAGLVFAMDRAADDGEILGRVEVGDVQLAGLTRAEAVTALRSVEAALGAEPIAVTIQDTTFTLMPVEIGFDLDEDALVDAAMRLGREGGFFTEMKWWVTHLAAGATQELGIQGTYDRDALLDVLRTWESAAIDDPPLDGGIAVQGAAAVAIYPKTGTRLDHEATADLIAAEILGDRSPVIAVTAVATPALTDADIDRAVDRAEALIGERVTLTHGSSQSALIIPSEVLRRSISSRIVTGEDGLAALELFFQIGPLAQHLDPIRDQVETPAVDAEVVIGPDDVPTVVPGSFESKVDDALLPDAVMAAANSITRTGLLPMRDGAAPDLTTEEAEALGIRSLLYTATTFYTAGGDTINQNRIHNIHLIADETDGAIVLPGEVFSLNDYVGERTAEGGYLPAKAVVYRGPVIGRIVYCCDHPANIGGGVSQFTTTLYNAIWWAGLEDVDHTPHSIYFTRYPLVREATLGYPTPDLRFRNNTEHGVLIKTEYTDNSITVKIYGDNGGFTVEGITSARRWFEPPYVYYEADPSLAPGVEEIRTEGAAGFTADVTRIITYPDGTEQSEKWTWTYDPNPKVIAVHPCSLPEGYPQREPTCPVQVPSVVGMTPGQAQATLQASGLGYSEGEPFPVSDPMLVGQVLAQSPPPDSWLALESPVTVRIGALA